MLGHSSILTHPGALLLELQMENGVSMSALLPLSPLSSHWPGFTPQPCLEVRELTEGDLYLVLLQIWASLSPVLALHSPHPRHLVNEMSIC